MAFSAFTRAIHAAKGLPAEYIQQLAAWRDAYEAHRATMVTQSWEADWSAKMRATYGRDACLAWNNELPWLLALLVARYGEWPITNWPTMFTPEDALRAQDWLAGRWPEGFTPIPVEN